MTISPEDLIHSLINCLLVPNIENDNFTCLAKLDPHRRIFLRISARHYDVSISAAKTQRNDSPETTLAAGDKGIFPWRSTGKRGSESDKRSATTPG